MMPAPRTLAAATIAFALSGSAGPAGSAATSSDADAATRTASASSIPLVGTWELDRDQSDDGGEKLREAMRSGPGGERGGRGGGRGRGGPGGGGMGGPRGGGPGGPGGRPGGAGEGRGDGEAGGGMRAAIEAPAVVTVAIEASAVTFRYPEGKVRTVNLGGDKAGELASDDAPAASTATWDGPRLVVHSKSGRGMESTETWEAGPDGNVLTVRVRLEGGRIEKPVDIFRVYRRQTAP